MEVELREAQIFQKYFGDKLSSEIKLKQVTGYTSLSLKHGMFHVYVEKTPLGSQGFVKIGYKPTAMTTVFSTPNEQGISFEQCCGQIKYFIDSQIDDLRDIVGR